MSYQPVTYKYTSTKEYVDAFPCAYRQYLTDSHCQTIHGYSFSMKFYFGTNDLDARNWVADYGGLKELKKILESQFDHTLLVAETDPHLDWYKEAEKRGYFKIDFLNVSIYQGVKSEEHLVKLMNQEPLWDLLLEDEFTNTLFHVNGHGAILRKMKPSSVEELAAVLAIIRPAKRYLIGSDWSVINKEVWLKPEKDEYYFKRSHAIAYAMLVVVQMNLICEQLNESNAGS